MTDRVGNDRATEEAVMTRLTRQHRALTAWSALCLGCGLAAEVLLRSF